MAFKKLGSSSDAVASVPALRNWRLLMVSYL